MRKTAFCLFVFVVFISSALAQNDFTVSSLFSNKMILQSEKEFRIYGNGLKGNSITIEIKTKDKTINRTAKVNSNGEWFADFPALPKNIECSLKFSNKKKTIEFNGVRTGDVWLIMGGSNTVHLMKNADLFEEEKSKTDFTPFQSILIPKKSAILPQSITEDAEWKNHNNANLPNIPSIAYYLGKTLSENLEVPIGIINCGYGGSLIEAWMSAPDLGLTHESLAKKNTQEKQQHKNTIIKLFENKFPYEVKIDSLDCDRSYFASSIFNDSLWSSTLVPEDFESKGLEDFDGVVWFRKDIVVPPGVDINKISLGYIDDSDEVFINGQFVGGVEDGYDIARVYEIPDNLITSGKNTIAVRVRDIGGNGGMIGDKKLYNLSGNGITIDISGDWKFRVEAVESDVEMNDKNRPAMLYNRMLAPITKFPVKGVVWYQGEVEAATPSDFLDYSNKLKKLIKGYRREFNNEELPFIIVQLPSFGDNKNEENTSWVDFKHAQDKTASETSNTEIISITDLINETNNFDIHLSNHKATGERIAKTALTKFYNSYSGGICPKVSEYKVNDNAIVLSFENACNLIVDDDYNYIKGFEIAGIDNVFHKVQAKVINDNKVLIQIENAPPVYVQYCRNANSIEGNLYNEERMPVMPFLIELNK